MIFIMGGKGFVGSAITRICQSKGREFVVIDKDNYNEFVGKQCEVFINANGNSKKYLAKEQPMWEFDASVRSVRASLEDFKYDKYIYLSSCDVYPDCSKTSKTCEDVEIDVKKQSTYGFHKYIAEQCVKHSAKQWIIFRMGGFVGQGMVKNPIFDILNDKPLWINPESELQFINTDDAAQIILNLIDRKCTNETFNLCGNGVIKINDIIELINKKVIVQSNSPTVKYEVNIDKILEHVNIPLTQDSVRNFVMKNREI